MTWAARIRMVGVVAVILVIGTKGDAQTSGQRLNGFSPAGAEAQLAREREFVQVPSAEITERYFDVMTAEPHHTGSPYQIKLADYVGELYKSFGMDVSRAELQRAHSLAGRAPPGDRRALGASDRCR